jgi:hypothetical protein
MKRDPRNGRINEKENTKDQRSARSLEELC